MSKKIPTILAIDTSCDDTAAAITQGYTVLSNVIASQTDLHKPYGGVFPTVAKQAHKENLEPTVNLALKRASKKWSDIDAIAVTQGPGLAPALEVGIAFAKEFSKDKKIPLIAVNHIEGHLLSVLAQPKKRNKKSPSNQVVELKNKTEEPCPEYTEGWSLSGVEGRCPQPFEKPTLSIIVSGGHTQFILVKNIGEYEIIGTTLDDAAGECLDKIGRMINLGYPAGPVIEHFAKDGNPHRFEFPLPMTHSHDYNLSFSGLKTHARNLLKKLDHENTFDMQDNIDFCASTQHGVFRAITYKLEKVLRDYPEISEVWLGGGVAANMQLRKTIRQVLKKVEKNRTAVTERSRSPISTIQPKMNTAKKLRLKTPYTKKLCQDNAAMIGVAAHYQLSVPERLLSLSKYKQEYAEKIERKPRWGLGEIGLV